MDKLYNLDNLGINALSEMQQKANKAISANSNDVVILAPTGTGKTLAYLLPVLQAMDSNERVLQAAVITPSHELAIQQNEVCQKLRTPFASMACYGGRSTMEEHRVMKSILPQIVFSTPGKFIDHCEKDNISVARLKFLVIDEFDKCMSLGFQKEISTIISLLSPATRIIFLSATDAEEIPQFIRALHHKMTKLDYLNDNQLQSQNRINYVSVQSKEKDKVETVAKLLSKLEDDSSIVFLNYRESVERLYDYLKNLNFSVVKYHGGMDQEQREQALYLFANGSFNTLICTDLGSRGLDMPLLKNVICYHLPDTEATFIHRSGRTARWKNTGNVYLITGPDEKVPDFLTSYHFQPMDVDATTISPLPPKMTTLYIGKGKRNKISKADVLGFICKNSDCDRKDIGRIDVFDRFAYVAVSQAKADSVVRATNEKKIKGCKTVVQVILYD